MRIMKNEGKLVIHGERTPKDEESVMRRTAKKSVIKRNLYEKGKVFERVPILHGYLMREVKSCN